MIGTSTFEYCFIRVCIIGLHYLVPLCILYCCVAVALYGVQVTSDRIPRAIEFIALAETLFYLLAYLPYRAYLQRKALHPAGLSRDGRRELFELCNRNIPDPKAYLQKWFLGAPLSEIKRENLKDFFLWAFFNRAGPPGADDQELEEYIQATEVLLGRKIEPGRGAADCLRLTLDRVDMLHRSLIWYWCVWFVDSLTYISLVRCRFQFHRTSLSRFLTLFPFRPLSLVASKKSSAKHLTYWHRQHTSKTKLPVLFIHGIGIGLYPYVTFLSDINSGSDPKDQVGIIAIEIMPVSFRITHPALSKSSMCEQIRVILKHHCWDKVVLVAHSYGTIVSTHLLKTQSTAHLIGSVLLIDPVSILLHLPDVAYNFTRRKPNHANEHQLYYFASMDMGVSHALSRHFFWAENILWKKDMEGRNFTLSLAGKDLIVNTEAVGRYLTFGDLSRTSSVLHPMNLLESESSRNGKVGSVSREVDVEADEDRTSWKECKWKGTGIEILWFQNLDHAQVFDKSATRKALVSVIQQYCADGLP